MPCTLCDLPTPDTPVTAEGVEGSFCCRGCLEVARVLDDAAGEDLAAGDGAAADAETVRDALAERSGGAASAENGTGEEATDRPTGQDGNDEAVTYLRVGGMHCATCEAFLEAEARAVEGVSEADASYPAGLMKVVRDPGALGDAELAERLDPPGYRVRDVEEGADPQRELGRLLVGGFFGMMAMALYALFLYPHYLGLSGDALLVELDSVGGLFVLLNVAVFSGVVLGYTGFPILRGAYVSLRAGRPNMDLLVALAATTAYAYSLLGLAVGRSEVFFDVSVVVVMAVTLGTYYEGQIREAAAGRFAEMAEERVTEARRRTAAGTETVPVEELAADDEVVVRPGERVPADGTVLEGAGAVDESLVTGESLPARVEPGDPVVGGAVVESGRVVVVPDPDGPSTLDRVLSVLWDVRAGRPGAQRLADRLAAVFVPVVLLLAVAAIILGLLRGAPVAEAVLTGLTVLVVSCPCALGLATPLAVASGVRSALERGIVITEGEVFERAPEADVVVLDKTGTLTTGEMRVLDAVGDPAAPRLAAAVETLADHPVADAVVEHADAVPGDVSGFERHPGRGVSATVAVEPNALPGTAPGESDPVGREVVVGRPALFEDRDWTLPAEFADVGADARAAGRIPVLVGWDGAVRGALVLGDEPRPNWRAAVAELADRADRVVVLSGDGPAATGRFGDHPGVDEAFAGVPPEGKAAVVERLRSEGTVVAVGDGSNDAPALAAADLGVALGGGTAMAADAADAVVASDDLGDVPAVFDLTAAARRRIRENLGWAFVYNAVAVPLAALGLFNPLFAALAMATSSLLVVTNSARSLSATSAAAPDRPEGREPPRERGETPVGGSDPASAGG